MTRSLRAKSVFRGSRDPYFLRDKAGTASLPTGDDWAFRIQVVSESTDIHTEMFKKAVQGLLKICFPQDVLNELGVDFIQQQMLEHNAPKQNIEKMNEIFRSEMIHRLVWMVAEYLDDTSKVESVVKSATAASAALHGNKIGPDILGNVIASLQRLRERVPNESTKVLGNDMVLTEFESDTVNNESSVAMSMETSQENELASSGMSDPSESEAEPLVGANAMADSNKVSETRKDSSEHTADHCSASGNTEKEIGHTVHPVREGKEAKVSTSWRWNVKQSDVTVDNIRLYFHRTVDLFSYHALPIAKETLGHDASRRDIRLQIESLWTSMSDDEYGKWVERFCKLNEGDLDMVDRAETTPSSSREGASSTTPAPITVHKTHSKCTSDQYNSEGRHEQGILASNHKITVKREAGLTSTLLGAASYPESHKRNNAIAVSSLSPRRSVMTQETTTDPKIYLFDRSSMPVRTPIIDLL